MGFIQSSNYVHLQTCNEIAKMKISIIAFRQNFFYKKIKAEFQARSSAIILYSKKFQRATII